MIVPKKNHSPTDPYTFRSAGKKSNNRAVLAAMTNKQSYDSGIISKNEIIWLLSRAKGGFGIITTAAANVSREGKGWKGELGLFDDIHIPNLIKLTTAVRSYDSLIFAQLFHGGMRSPQSLTGVTPISASKLKCDESDSGLSREASEEDIKKIVEDFTLAAVRCYDAGFDGIELHGAHGYLISQFLGTKTNLRQDKWGITLEGRSRLLIQIYRSIRQSLPESFIVGVRISPEIESIGIDLLDSINLVCKLRDEGVDFIHLSCWDSFSVSSFNLDSPKTYTEIIIENCCDLPAMISTGGVWSSSDAIKLLSQGTDLIGVGRVGIAYPDWAKNLMDKEYNPGRPPFTTEHLKDAKLSKVFIDYMRRWEGFVIDS